MPSFFSPFFLLFPLFALFEDNFTSRFRWIFLPAYIYRAPDSRHKLPPASAEFLSDFCHDPVASLVIKSPCFPITIEFLLMYGNRMRFSPTIQVLFPVVRFSVSNPADRAARSRSQALYSLAENSNIEEGPPPVTSHDYRKNSSGLTRRPAALLATSFSQMHFGPSS